VPENKSVSAANQPVGLKFTGDSPGGISGVQQNELALDGRYRNKQCPVKPSSSRESGEQQKCENSAQGIMNSLISTSDFEFRLQFR
jgi:hypothetical protein